MFVSRNGIDDLPNNLYWNLVCHFPSYRSSLSHIFFTTGVLKNFANFSLNASKFVIRDFNTGDFLWNLEKLLKTLFFTEHPRWPLLFLHLCRMELVLFLLLESQKCNLWYARGKELLLTNNSCFKNLCRAVSSFDLCTHVVFPLFILFKGVAWSGSLCLKIPFLVYLPPIYLYKI